MPNELPFRKHYGVLICSRLSSIFLIRNRRRMAFIFRRLRGDNAGDEDSEDEDEALLADASDPDSSGESNELFLSCAVSTETT